MGDPQPHNHVAIKAHPIFCYPWCITFALFQRVQTGEYYCVAGTTCNDLLFWGTRFKHPPKLDESWNRGSTPGNSRSGLSSARGDLRLESAGGSTKSSNSSVASVREASKDTDKSTENLPERAGEKIMLHATDS